MQANSTTIPANKAEILNEENTTLKDRISKLEYENSQLKNRIGELEKKIEELELSKEKRREEKKWLLSKNKGRLCHQDCVLCAMVWFCTKKLNNNFCGRKLEKIILVAALTRRDIEIDKKHLIECSGLMIVLEKCEIVNLANVFEYSHDKSERKSRNDKIDEVWNRLFLMSEAGMEEHVILGRISKNQEPGHIWICDLAKKAREKVKIHDPQHKMSFDVSKQEFREYVTDDAGLQLFTVKWDELRYLIECYEGISHCAQHNTKCTHTGTSKDKNE